MALTVSTPASAPAGQPAAAASGGALSNEQFARLEELLMPGYLLSKAMLADYQSQQDARPADPTPAAPPATPDV